MQVPYHASMRCPSGPDLVILELLRGIRGNNTLITWFMSAWGGDGHGARCLPQIRSLMLTLGDRGISEEVLVKNYSKTVFIIQYTRVG